MSEGFPACDTIVSLVIHFVASLAKLTNLIIEFPRKFFSVSRISFFPSFCCSFFCKKDNNFDFNQDFKARRTEKLRYCLVIERAQYPVIRVFWKENEAIHINIRERNPVNGNRDEMVFFEDLNVLVKTFYPHSNQKHQGKNHETPSVYASMKPFNIDAQPSHSCSFDN